MTYSFASLSPADFEDLARDLLGRECGCRFEAFGPGPDGGIDGRHAKSGEKLILQAKHYRMSGFSALAHQMRRERGTIDRLVADRYVLTTSVSLTPSNKKALAEIIGPSLKAMHDINGFEDLNGLLRKHPEIAKNHVKLWLSDTAVLERILNAASHNFTSLTRSDIAAKLHVYAENPSFSSGRKILEDHRVLIISGPPGVGKTTLAEMLAYAYIGEDWELIAVRSLNDGFTRLDDTRKQVFFFDDFLGRIALDERALSTQDSELARFIARVRRTPTARFILTTRAYIYEHAKLFSESLSDRRLNVASYVLDVSVYTQRIRARILYNHLIVAGVPTDFIRALNETGTIRTIVYHDHYNPRIVQWMTDMAHLGDVTAVDYPIQFVDALNNPELIWDKAFRYHIPNRCRHLLFALYFASQYGAAIDDVREIFEGIHPLLCSEFGLTSDFKDFEESLKTLEGSFVAIANGSVSFINPSIRDYLANYLNDKSLSILMAKGASNASCAARMVDQFEKLSQINKEDWVAMLSRFSSLSSKLNTIPKWRPISSKPGSLRHYDIGNGERIEMLLSWWRKSSVQTFLDTAIEIATKPHHGFSSWADARALSDILADLRTCSDSNSQKIIALAAMIEKAIHDLLRSNLDPDDLDRIIKAIERNIDVIGARFEIPIAAAIPRMINSVAESVHHIDSESTLNDFVTMIESLSQRIEIDPVALASAKRTIERRIEEVNENAKPELELAVTGDITIIFDTFDDQDLNNLFAPLVATDD